LKTNKRKYTALGLLIGLAIPITGLSVIYKTDSKIIPFLIMILLIPTVLSLAFRYIGQILDEKDELINKEEKLSKKYHDYEKQFSAIYNLTDDAMLMSYDDGIFSCNDSTLIMFGLSSSTKINGLKLSDLAPKRLTQDLSSFSFMTFEEAIIESKLKDSVRFETLLP